MSQKVENPGAGGAEAFNCGSSGMPNTLIVTHRLGWIKFRFPADGATVLIADCCGGALALRIASGQSEHPDFVYTVRARGFRISTSAEWDGDLRSGRYFVVLAVEILSEVGTGL